MIKIVSEANTFLGHGVAVGRVSIASEGRFLIFVAACNNEYPYIHTD